MDWFRVTVGIGSPLLLFALGGIVKMLGMILKQNKEIQALNEERRSELKIETDRRILIVEADTKEIKDNYLARFAEVNDNISELKNEVTNRLTAIEIEIRRL
jgi:hypothetical protein